MKAKKFFYGWLNLAILWFCYCSVVASVSYAFGVVVSGMSDDFGMSMTTATGAYTCYYLVHSLSAPLAGKAISRIGVKKSMIMGLGLMLIGSVILALAPCSIWIYYAFWIVFIGLGMRFGTLLPSQVNIADWFFEYRGLAMALLLTAGGVGGFVFSSLCARVNERYSWRGVWFMIAGFIALSILLVLLFLKNKPEELGQSLDGGKAKIKTAKKQGCYKTTEAWTLKNALKMPAFYMLIFMYFASSYQLSAISSQGINHMTMNNISQITAASAVGLFALINTFGRIIVGILGDKQDIRKLLAFGTVLSVVGFYMLNGAETPAEAYVSMLFSGLGYGIIMVAPQNLLLNYFGNNDYANINGFYSMLAGILSSLPSVIIGWFFDKQGDYTFAWVLGIALMVICFAVAVVISPPRLKTEDESNKLLIQK